MREAMGSTWLIGIIITFIAIFSGFLAYSIGYTKAFKVKNEIINIIENSEGYSVAGKILSIMSDSELDKDEHTDAKIYKYIKSIGYNYSRFENGSNPCEKSSQLKEGGYCLTKYCDGNGSVRYKVTTYISLSIPVINLGFNIPITGETKSMYYDVSKYECDN